MVYQFAWVELLCMSISRPWKVSWSNLKFFTWFGRKMFFQVPRLNLISNGTKLSYGNFSYFLKFICLEIFSVFMATSKFPLPKYSAIFDPQAIFTFAVSGYLMMIRMQICQKYWTKFPTWALICLTLGKCFCFVFKAKAFT